MTDNNPIEPNEKSQLEAVSAFQSDFSRSGVRRAGDEYQDAVALGFLVEMLEHPSRYEWVQVEADDAGWLDDVVARRFDGVMVARQVKFSAHPESNDDPYDWEDLLRQRQGKRGPTRSLLAKWAYGFGELKATSDSIDAALVSNRRAGLDIEAVLLPDGRVNFDRIDADVRIEITRQLGSEGEARTFFGVFRFDLDHPDLEVLEETLRERFLNLSGTSEGWDRLRNELRKWVRNRKEPPPNGKITLGAVKAACLWNIPKAIPQDFPVPADFVISSRPFHEDLLAKIHAREPWIVIAASPGVGKSTYLSYLAAELAKSGTAVIRHHFFLDWTDSTLGRRSHEVIASSLIAELRQLFPGIEQRITDNPAPQHLTAWLEVAAQEVRAQAGVLVLILDGLDHVWRDDNSVAELNKLFDLVPVQDGLVVLVGTQPVEDAKLPRKLLQFAARQQWLELPMFDNSAIREWLLQNKALLPLAEYANNVDYFLDQLVITLMDKSEGHPLYLHYTLRALVEQGRQVTPQEIQALPACPHHDITRYYQQLWVSLPDSGRQILHLLTVCTFSWPREAVMDCLDPSGKDRPDFEKALREVVHLTSENGLGVHPAHTSLTVFVADCAEHKDYVGLLQQKALNWLKYRAPELWRWGHAWLLENEMGNSTPLADGPDRAWVVDALARGRPTETVNLILAEAGLLALRNRRLGRFVELGLLADYFNSGIDLLDTNSAGMAPVQLSSLNDPYLIPSFEAESNQSDEVLVAIAEYRFGQGDNITAERMFKEMNTRLRNSIRKEPPEGVGNPDFAQQHARSLVRLAAISQKVRPEKVANWITRTRDTKARIELFSDYIAALRAFGRAEQALALLRYTRRWPTKGRWFILSSLVPLISEEGIRLGADTLTESDLAHPLIAVLQRLYRANTDLPATIRLPIPWLLKLKEHEQFDKRDQMAAFFQELFLGFLANALWSREQETREYLDSLDRGKWTVGFIETLADAAKIIANTLLEKATVPYDVLFTALDRVVVPTFGNNRDEHHIGISARRAVVALSSVIRSLASISKPAPTVPLQEIERVFDAPIFNADVWLRAYVADRRNWLSTEAAEWVLEHEEKRYAAEVTYFSERAESYVLLANFASVNRIFSRAVTLIQEAAANLVSYGYRKDYLLTQTLDAVCCAKKLGLDGVARAWIVQLAPAIANVSDFTDGKGTRHVPQQLGDILAQYFPEWFPRYYRWLVEQEDYYDAQEVFQSYLKYANLSEPLNQAVGGTGIDESSLYLLKTRAEAGDVGAAECLQSMEIFSAPQADPDDKRSTPKEDHVTEALPDPDDFPPADFTKFLQALQPAGWRSEEQVAKWARHWHAKGMGADVLPLVDQYYGSRGSTSDYKLRFDLALEVYGRQAAFHRLLAAFSDSYGWTYFAGMENSKRFWRVVLDYYPERWYEFIEKTIVADPFGRTSGITAHNTCLGLMEFCAFFSQVELAREVGDAMVNGVVDIVSPLNLTKPAWLLPDE